MKTSMLLLAAVTAIAAPAVAAELDLDGEFPVVGQSSKISLTGVDDHEGLELRVVYSPNSETSSIEKAGAMSPDGELVWTPSRPGIATLAVVDPDGDRVAVENVAILFATTPVSGLLVMLFAGLLLFGGAAFSLRTVLAGGVPEQAPPLDT